MKSLLHQIEGPVVKVLVVVVLAVAIGILSLTPGLGSAPVVEADDASVAASAN
jgi:hypothetical protein